MYGAFADVELTCVLLFYTKAYSFHAYTIPYRAQMKSCCDKLVDIHISKTYKNMYYKKPAFQERELETDIFVHGINTLKFIP